MVQSKKVIALLKDKNGKDVEYDDLVKINEEKTVLRQAIDIPMIDMMKHQGYLHLFECEIELIAPHDEAIDTFPELYI